MNTLSEHMRAILLLAVSVLGAALGYVSRQWGLQKTIRLSRFIFSVFAAIFMLILLRTACNLLGLSYEWTLLIVGLFSWMGTEVTVSVLERIVYRKLGLSHVYVKTEASNCRDNPLESGGVYTVDELQKSELKARESGSNK